MAALRLKDGVYFIQNRGSGTCMELHDGSSDNDTKVEGHRKRDLDDELVDRQLWIITNQGGTYKIQSARSGKYMEVPDTSGSSVVCNASSIVKKQKWDIVRSNAGTAYVIQNQSSNNYADLEKGSDADGTSVLGSSGVGSATTSNDQLWHIVRA